jgi:hypothetical protein
MAGGCKIEQYSTYLKHQNRPAGHDAQWYFQQAYNIAVEAIDNPGPFKLQPTFYDVHLASKTVTTKFYCMPTY